MNHWTLVCGIDERTWPQLEVSFPTWAVWKKEIVTVPMIVFYDAHCKSFDIQQVKSYLQQIRCGNPVIMVAWHGIGETQRERMLAGFIHVPPSIVHTRYWCKIDTDAVALDGKEWIDESWFTSEQEPAIIASPWNYTKPADQMHQLDEWADRHNIFNSPRLNIPFTPGARTVPHSRIASWICFVETGFSRNCAVYATRHSGQNMIPVPSQDGYHWYVAQRYCRHIEKRKFKKFGWTNCPRLIQLKQTAEESMQRYLSLHSPVIKPAP